MTNQAQAAVQVDHVSKRFGGVAALDDVSVRIPAGQVTCLAGENGCGKSTLIKVIVGVERPDAGTITLAGQPTSHISPTRAVKAGVQVIYQDLSLFANLTVAENIAFGGWVAAGARLVRPARMRAGAAGVLSRLGVDLELGREVGQLPVAQRQIVAIARALAHDARVLFMDEPTTALTIKEIDALFAVVATLTQQGVAVVFVSHKLEEVFAISQHVTVLRAGRVTAHGPASGFSRASLARAMTGRDVFESRIVTPVPDAAPAVLRVSGLTLPGAFRDVDLTVRAGEIVGVTGLLGSGRQEIAEALFGLTPAAGRVEVGGRAVAIRGVRDAIAAGIAYVPADRLTQGIFLDQGVDTNLVSASLDQLSRRGGWLARTRVEAAARRDLAALRIKTASPQAPARTLSGGNQQRVVLAKWLAREPAVLVLNMPTVGVDVGSKEEILQILRDQAARGMGIVVISDDSHELAAVCHRVHVVRCGLLRTALEGDAVTAERIMQEVAA